MSDELGFGSKLAMILGEIFFLIATVFAYNIYNVFHSQQEIDSFGEALGNLFAILLFLVFWYGAILLAIILFLIGRIWRQQIIFTSISLILTSINFYFIPITIYLNNPHTFDSLPLSEIKAYTIILLPLLIILILSLLALIHYFKNRESMNL